jgi:hypothetical protein
MSRERTLGPAWAVSKELNKGVAVEYRFLTIPGGKTVPEFILSEIAEKINAVFRATEAWGMNQPLA